VGDPWNTEAAPEARPIFAAGRPISLSGRTIPGKLYDRFFLGGFLAFVHKAGYRYTDFHTGNIGLIPRTGIYVIIDYGGSVKCALDPAEMAGDFIVPSLELTPEELEAFVCGYIETAHREIDPGFSGYSSSLLAALGCHTITNDPRAAPPGYLRALQILDELFDAGARRHDARPDDELLRLAAAIILLGSDTGRSRAAYVLARLFPAADGATHATARSFLGTALSSQHRPLLDGLAFLADVRLLAGDGRQITAGECCPRAKFAAELLDLLDANPSWEPLRTALSEVSFALMRSSSAEDIASIRTSLNAATLGVGLCLDHTTNVERFEKNHYLFWSALGAAGLSSRLNSDAVDADERLAQCLLLGRAAMFELEFWGASFSRKRLGKEEVCWHALDMALQSARQSVLLAEGLLPAMQARGVSDTYVSVLAMTLEAYRHANRCVGGAVMERLDVPVNRLSGGDADVLIGERKWLESFITALRKGVLTTDRYQQLFDAGKAFTATSR
jgi:hypothetical protein